MARRKILLVEKDQELQLAIAIRLKASGYDVKYAANAQTAASLARQEAPDLVLVGPGLAPGAGDEIEWSLDQAAMAPAGPMMEIGAVDHAAPRPRAGSAGIMKVSDNSDDLIDRLSAFFSSAPARTPQNHSRPKRRRTTAKRP